MVNIDSVKFGEVEIDGKVYYSDMIVWWDGKIGYREKSHTFDISEFAALLQRKPDTIIIGTGLEGIVKVDPEVSQMAEDKGIEIYIDKSPKAAKIFNSFAQTGKKVVAIIHSTC